MRRRLHPEGVVSYTIDGRVDFANSADDAGFECICDRISGIVAMGGTGVMLRGEVVAALTIAWFDALFRRIKERFPALWLHSLSASEILAIAHQSGLTVHDTIAQLRDAGGLVSTNRGVYGIAPEYEVGLPHSPFRRHSLAANDRESDGMDGTSGSRVVGGGGVREARVSARTVDAA